MPKIAEAARAERRDQIIAAGLTCFARTGYHATTMADIAAQAGVSKGTPYLYFESKEALFIGLHEEWDCGLNDRVNAAVAALPEAGRRSPRQILRAAAAAVAGHVTEHAQTCRVLMQARALAAHEPAIAATVKAADARAHEQLEGLIAAGVAAGEWPAGTDPALAARLFTAGLYGLMAQWHPAPSSFSWDAAAAALADTGDRPHAGPHTRHQPSALTWKDCGDPGDRPGAGNRGMAPSHLDLDVPLKGTTGGSTGPARGVPRATGPGANSQAGSASNPGTCSPSSPNGHASASWPRPAPACTRSPRHLPRPPAHPGRNPNVTRTG